MESDKKELTVLSVEQFLKGSEMLKNIGRPEPQPLIFTRIQIEIFKMQGENVTDTTVNGFPYVIIQPFDGH